VPVSDDDDYDRDIEVHSQCTMDDACRLRSLGSAALHMCFVAAGHLDAHFTYGIHIWDMAAGELIVREAGGIVCDTSGSYCSVWRFLTCLEKSVVQKLGGSGG